MVPYFGSLAVDDDPAVRATWRDPDEKAYRIYFDVRNNTRARIDGIQCGGHD
jgi:hypothetical protein